MKIRSPAVAGSFYPDDADELRRQISGFLHHAEKASAAKHPKVLIAPHAGYIYSGPTAACAYAQLDAALIRRVIMLGPTHRVPVRGLALPDCQAFSTPLGDIPLDAPGIGAIAALPQVVTLDAAHAWEHSLEVHLPFLQTVLGSFTLVPLAVGHATASEVAEVLDKLWGGDETLIIISSDLSHFLPYAVACDVDRATIASILDLTSAIDHEQACGATPINGLLALARRKHLVPTLLDYRNSGDTAGDRQRVVGYASIAFTEADGKSW